jgi:hypothetical protein
MKKQKIWLIILTILLSAVLLFTLVGTVKADLRQPKIFEDVSTTHPFATWIKWLKDNGITSGYPDGTFRPNNFISRAEMAVMLKNTASTVVAAGVHIEHNGSAFVVTEWFNNVTGTKPVYNWLPPAHSLGFGFDLSNRFFACTVDGTDSITALCSVSNLNSVILVTVYDVQDDSFSEPIGVWILVYGKDI